MEQPFDTLDAAFMTLANPEDPRWSDAFSFLARQPETGQLIIDTFRETLEQMGVEPSGTDPSTGEPSYSLADIARAMGVPAEELEGAMARAAGTAGEPE
jgi:hypothetical protein